MAKKQDLPFLQLAPGDAVHLAGGPHGPAAVRPAWVENVWRDVVGLSLAAGESPFLGLREGGDLFLLHASRRVDRVRVARLSLSPTPTVLVEPRSQGLRDRHDQRRAPRVEAANLFGFVTVLLPNAQRRFRVQILDLSIGGAMLLSARELAVRQELSLELRLRSDQPPLILPGQIAWQRTLSDNFGLVGLQFGEMAAPARGSVESLLFRLRWEPADDPAR